MKNKPETMLKAVAEKKEKLPLGHQNFINDCEETLKRKGNLNSLSLGQYQYLEYVWKAVCHGKEPICTAG